MLRIKNYIIATLLLVTSANTFAKHPKSINWLMEQPVTAFDLGMYRLNQRMEELADRFIPIKSASAKYIDDEKSISIFIYVDGEKIKEDEITENVLRDKCKRSILEAKKHIGIFFSKKTSVADLFLEQVKSKPKDITHFRNEIDKIIKFQSVVVYYGDVVVCNSTVSNDDIYYGKRK
ncbi:hypothetical protein [Endozoicomonas lisbonensis]|uniref:Uncharacterized protein n=1 Tax=Endozoicomonas lisbonensis TaxID=3120522 RepID=A0ABV2SCW3_9GAMM